MNRQVQAQPLAIKTTTQYYSYCVNITVLMKVIKNNESAIILKSSIYQIFIYFYYFVEICCTSIRDNFQIMLFDR